MNSITLSFGKNMANLAFGNKDGDKAIYAGAGGPNNKVILGDINAKKPKATHSSEEAGVSAPLPKKGFTAYWVVENHGSTATIRIHVDLKANTLELALQVAEDWKVVSTTNLEVFPNPEFKFYNYRSTLTAKPVNAPKRPRGRPRKASSAEASDSEAEPKRPRGRPRKVAVVEQPVGPAEEQGAEPVSETKRPRGRPRKAAVAEPAAEPVAKRPRGRPRKVVPDSEQASA